MMRLTKLILIGLSIIYLMAGCSSPSEQPQSPDASLLSYLPDKEGIYLGDGDYYHVITEIETMNQSDSENRAGITLKGEVNRQTQGNDDRFEIALWVDGDSLIQTTTGRLLNDSPLSEVVLLKAPVEVGRKWLFVTEDLEGNRQKITATILDVDDENSRVNVRYEGKDGYYEERTIERGLGVTDFVRTVLFKGEYALTGYHLENVEPSTSASDEIDRIEIPTKSYALIWGFNQAWVKKWQGIDDSILTFVAPESPAIEKINAITESSDDVLTFVEFIPYEILDEEGMTKISVVEHYEDQDGNVTENRLKYTITLDNKIWDFERLD